MAGGVIRHVPALVLMGLGAMLLAACASETDLAARSPITRAPALTDAIAQALAQPLPAPTFRDIPMNPPDMRPAAAWEQSSTALQGQGRELAAVAASPVELPDPEAWGKRAAASAGLDAISPPGPNNAAELEALGRELRERATPPPPPY
jgi:hypothetical protein